MFARLMMGVTMLALVALTTTAQAQVPRTRRGIPAGHNLPPAQMLMHPGPGVGGPGPGVLAARRGINQGPGGAAYGPFGAIGHQTVQVLFDKPELLQVRWDVGGIGQYDSTPLIVPGRQNFQQGGIYRLKITNIPGRPALCLYPTLEIGPASPRLTAALRSKH